MIAHDTAQVCVQVTKADGTVERVCVGTAFRSGDGWTVRLQPMTLEAGGYEELHPAAASSSGARNVAYLESYAERARARLADPKKARWHDSDKTLLAEIEAELARLKTLS